MLYPVIGLIGAKKIKRPIIVNEKIICKTVKGVNKCIRNVINDNAKRIR